MSAMTSQITRLTIAYSTVYLGTDQRKHQRFPSLVFVKGIYRIPMNSPHEGPVTRKMFPFDDVIMTFAFTGVSLPVNVGVQFQEVTTQGPTTKPDRVVVTEPGNGLQVIIDETGQINPPKYDVHNGKH